MREQRAAAITLDMAVIRQSITTWLTALGQNSLAAMTLLVVLAVFLVMSLRAGSFVRAAGPDPVNANEISVLSVESSDRLRRRKITEPRVTLDEQFKVPANAGKQYTYLFKNAQDAPLPTRVIVPFVQGKAQVFVNGVFLGYESDRSYLIKGETRAFIDLTIPLGLFQSGNNRIEFIVTPVSSRASLSEIYLGPDASLSPLGQSLERNKFIPFFWALMAIILGVMIAAGLALRRDGRPYLLFTGLCGVLTLKAILKPDMQITEAVGAHHLMIIAEVALAPFIVLLIIQMPRPWGAVRAALALLAVLAVTLGAFGAAPHDQGAAFNNVAPLLALGPPLFIGASLAQQLHADYSMSQQSQNDALKRLAEQEKVIDDQRAALDLQIKKSAQMEERQRLTRDIHDGIGGHLLSLLVRVKSGDASVDQIESELQAGLNDLRLIVDSMDHSADDLESALKTFQARLRPQLAASAITLDWTFSDPFTPGHYGPKTVLNLYRFMQEAVSNTVRHAKATQLCVRLSCAAPQAPFTLYMADNGRGLKDGELTHAGQGLKNMTTRAKALGADMIRGTDEDGGGLSYTLILPPPQS